jgi:hypothetical protein
MRIVKVRIETSSSSVSHKQIRKDTHRTDKKNRTNGHFSNTSNCFATSLNNQVEETPNYLAFSLSREEETERTFVTVNACRGDAQFRGGTVDAGGDLPPIGCQQLEEGRIGIAFDTGGGALARPRVLVGGVEGVHAFAATDAAATDRGQRRHGTTMRR